MPQRLRIKLNLARIAANLSKEDARPTSEQEVVRWLKEAGFERQGDWWLVAERDLGQVDPSEVLEIAPDEPGSPETLQ